MIIRMLGRKFCSFRKIRILNIYLLIFKGWFLWVGIYDFFGVNCW